VSAIAKIGVLLGSIIAALLGATFLAASSRVQTVTPAEA
jgi:Na+/H+ antiporter NhaA